MSTTPVAEQPDGPALVADLLSGDRMRIHGATWAIIRTRDEAALRAVFEATDAIEAAMADIDLGGAFASNARHVQHAIGRAWLPTEGRCLCTAYLHHDMYEPDREVERGHVRIDEVIEVLDDGRPDRPRRICSCTACGRRFHVEEGDWHYTWWQWRPLEEVEAEQAATTRTPDPVVTNPRSPARARRRRSSPSA